MSTKKDFAKGIAFVAAAKYSGFVISLVITSILARLLTPEDFGIIAIATVFITFFNLLGDMGLGPAVIQFRNLTQKDLSSLLGLSFWVGLGLAIVFFFASYIISFFYQNPKLVVICQLLSIQIFFSILNIVPQSILLKEKKFNIVAYRNVGVQIFCGLIAVFYAYKGLGVYSLIIAPIGSSILSFAINIYYNRLKIKIIPAKAPIIQVASFSSYQLLFNFVNYFGRNLDKLVIGKSLNLADLGYYEKSYRLMLLPVENINSIVSPVLHPFLSEWQNDTKRIFNTYKRLLRLLLYLSFPVAGLLFGASRELILIIFGNQWYLAIPCFEILSLSVAFQMPCSISGAIFQACNKTKILFRLGTLNVIVAILGLTIAVAGWNNLSAICIAFDIGTVFSFISSLYVISKYCFKSSWSFLPNLLYHPFLLMMVLLIIFHFLSPIFSNLHMFLSLGIKFVLWLGVCLLYFRLFTDFRFNQLKNFIHG